MSNKSDKKVKSNKKRKLVTILTILFGIVLVISGFIAYMYANQINVFSKTSSDAEASGSASDDEKLPVCVFNDKGEVKYILYTEDGMKLFMFDNINGFTLDNKKSNIHNIEFFNDEMDKIIVTSNCPEWCDAYYNGYDGKVDSRYNLVVRGHSTEGTTENFGYDIWEDTESNLYTAIFPITDTIEMAITFTSEENTNIPTFNRLDVVEAYLDSYF